MKTQALRRRLAAAGAVAFVLVPALGRAADVNDVLARMRQALEPGKDMRADFTFVINNGRGEDVRWSGRLYRQSGSNVRTRLVFDTPLDMRGTELTLRRRAGETTEARVYLPAIRRVRDVTGNTRGESFLGTDFNYEDLGFQHLDYQQHALREDGKIADRPCYVLESIPDQGWWYGKIVRWIDKKTYLPLRTEYYDRSGVQWKVRTFEHVKTVDSFPTATTITMDTVPLHTATRIELSNVDYNVGLSDDVFREP